MGNRYSNPYRDESIAGAISGLGGALFGHPEAINSHLDRSLRQQQLNQSQSNWQAEHDSRQAALGFQQAEANRQAELHPYELKKVQAELDAKDAEMRAQEDKLVASGELLNIFKDPNNYRNINGSVVINPELIPQIQSLHFRIDPSSNLNQDHFNIFGGDTTKKGKLQLGPDGQAYLVSEDFNNPVAVPVRVAPDGAPDGAPPSNPAFLRSVPNDPQAIDASNAQDLPDSSKDFVTPLEGGTLADVFAPANTTTTVTNQRSNAPLPVPQNNPGEFAYFDAPGSTATDPSWGTERTRQQTNAEFTERAAVSMGLAQEVSSLMNNPDLLEGSRIGVGVPGLDQVIMGATELLNTDKMTDVRALETAKIFDWLEKSSKLKGAITEMENAQLKADQPPPNASAESKKTWLQKLNWYLVREAMWNDLVAKSAADGQPFPSAITFYSEYEKRMPRPQKVRKGQLRAPTAPQSGQKPPQTAPQGQQTMVPTETDLQFMTPEERALFQQ